MHEATETHPSSQRRLPTAGAARGPPHTRRMTSTRPGWTKAFMDGDEARIGQEGSILLTTAILEKMMGIVYVRTGQSPFTNTTPPNMHLCLPNTPLPASSGKLTAHIVAM